jgi:hypothetical protein
MIVIEGFVCGLERCTADERVHRILSSDRRGGRRGATEILGDGLPDQRSKGYATTRRAKRQVAIRLFRQPDIGRGVP